jgi:hypothetical protein
MSNKGYLLMSFCRDGDGYKHRFVVSKRIYTNLETAKDSLMVEIKNYLQNFSSRFVGVTFTPEEIDEACTKIRKGSCENTIYPVEFLPPRRNDDRGFYIDEVDII